MSLDIRLKKADRVYHEGDTVAGVVVVTSKGDMAHNGITLNMDGWVNLQLSSKSVGVFEAFYNSIKPIQLLSYSLEIARPGKFPNGVTEIPFEFPLKGKPGQPLYETYHGVFVNIQYNLKCDMKRSMLNKDLNKQVEFLVENKIDPSLKPKETKVDFKISPDTLDNVRQKDRVSPFKISGHLNTATCSITKPLLGNLIVESSETDIKSIELQLLRVETCGCAEGYAKDATEIQNIQIADGDVCRGQSIPVHMIFPRLFTCPTLATKNFKVEFEVNIVVVFQDGHLVTENFPIKLVRDCI